MRAKRIIIIGCFLIPTFFSTKAQNSTGSFNCLVHDTISNRVIYSVVDTMPEFPGGIDSLYEFIRKDIYQSTRNDADCHECIFISFVIETDGAISNLTFDSLNYCFEYINSIINLITRMPLWYPGKCNGMVVPVRYVLPIIVPPDSP